MNDIFISYSKEDRSRAESLSKALKEQGWSVWWDRTIPPGKTFDRVIEEAITTARCVVVLWSETSIKSDWVKEEANIAKERGILVPAKIDPVDLPLGFGRIQAADLINWETETNHPGFLSLRNAISGLAGPPPGRDKNVQDTELPESNLEQKPEVRSKESESFHPAPSHHKPVEKEPPPTDPRRPRKRRLAYWIGAVVLILVVSVIGWFYYSNISERSLPISKREAFNPMSQILRIPNANLHNPKRQITLEAWFNTDAIGKRQAIITKLHPEYKRGEPYYQYNLELRDTGKLYFALSINGIRRSLDQVFKVEPNQWYHVAATYNGKVMQLYMNGTKSGETIQGGRLDVYGEPLVIGGDSNDRPFIGQLAKVRIWKVARTGDQIRDAMKKTISPIGDLIFSSTNWLHLSR